MVARAGLPLQVHSYSSISGANFGSSDILVSLWFLIHCNSTVVLLQDLEFVQFHPTGIYGVGCLITEGTFFSH